MELKRLAPWFARPTRAAEELRSLGGFVDAHRIRGCVGGSVGKAPGG